MSSILTPERDPEVLLELKERHQDFSLKELAESELGDVEPQKSYDIAYNKDKEMTRRKPGTYFHSGEIAPSYDGPEIDIEAPIETNVEKFYTNLETGEFRLETEDGEDRNYILVLSNNKGIILKGETGYGDNKELTTFIYEKNGDKNHLKINRGGWCQYGKAPYGEGNNAMRHAELIEDIYQQLQNTAKEHKTWTIEHTGQFKSDMEELGPSVKSTFDNKIEDLEENLQLGIQPSEYLNNLNTPWNNLDVMRLGNHAVATLLNTEKISEKHIERELPDKTLYALRIHTKKEAEKKFHSPSNGKDKSKGKISGGDGKPVSLPYIQRNLD